jgi:hypothetical protein
MATEGLTNRKDLVENVRTEDGMQMHENDGQLEKTERSISAN